MWVDASRLTLSGLSPQPRRHPGAAHSVSTRQAWLVARFRSRLERRDAVAPVRGTRRDRTGRIPEPTPTLHRYTCIGQRLGHAPYSHCVRAPSADERSAYRHFGLRSVLNQYQAEISTPCVQRSVHRSLRRPRLIQSRRFPHALTGTYHCTTTRNGAPQPVISF